jgi:hypothetical protein
VLSGEPSVSETTLPVERQELWYFVLRDCKEHQVYDYSYFGLQIKLNLEIINNGGYMGEEEDHWLIVPLIIAIGFWLIFSDKHFLTGSFPSDPDHAKMVLFAAITCNVSSLVWRGFGYIIYRNFGINYLLFHLIYMFMHAISETIILALIVLVSMGWTLNFVTGPRLNLALPIRTSSATQWPSSSLSTSRSPS